MSRVHPAVPTFDRPKLVLQAFHLCKARSKVEDAEVIWDTLADLATPLRIADLEKLPKLTQLERDRIVKLAEDAVNSYSSEHRQEVIVPLLTTLPGNTLEIDIPASLTSPSVKGGIYPAMIHDSYAIDLTRCYDNSQFTVTELSKHLNPKGCLLPSSVRASIGQTLLLFGKPVDWPENEAEFLEVAKGFALALLQDAAPSDRAELYLSGRGKFFGGSILEFESEHPNPILRIHILVWLDNHPQTAALEAKGDYYHAMLQLLLSRSKIQWAANQAELSYREAGRLYEQLEQTARDFQEVKLKQDEALWQQLEEQTSRVRNRQLKPHLDRLLKSEPAGLQNRLETILKQDPNNRKLARVLTPHLDRTREERLNILEDWLLAKPQETLLYGKSILDIQNQLTTIEINTENFADRLRRLQELALPDIDDLTFWSKFVSRDCQRHLKQAKYNLAYLATGRSLFDQTIETIRGLVEIEGQKQQLVREAVETTRSRNLNILVASVGTGLSVTSISASGVGQKVVQYILEILGFKLTETTIEGAIGLYLGNLLFHALVGGFFAIVAGVLFWWLTRHSKGNL
jgi:hypothetical protein